MRPSVGVRLPMTRDEDQEPMPTARLFQGPCEFENPALRLEGEPW
jgi:hypothetical protein